MKMCKECKIGEICKIHNGLLYVLNEPLGEDLIVLKTVAQHCRLFQFPLDKILQNRLKEIKIE